MVDKNPERDQDRAFDLYDTYKKYGYVMFPQQRRIYEQLVDKMTGSVLEAGCGSGLGTALLDMEDTHSGSLMGVTGTDKIQKNVEFAKCLYPWIDFQVWDITQPWKHAQRDMVVAVEVIEHVADPVTALRNLIAAATETVWISTPNGKNSERPPSNPYHVCEYTIEEMSDMICQLLPKWGYVVVHAWDDFRVLSPSDVDVTPLVYELVLHQESK